MTLGSHRQPRAACGFREDGAELRIDRCPRLRLHLDKIRPHGLGQGRHLRPPVHDMGRDSLFELRAVKFMKPRAVDFG